MTKEHTPQWYKETKPWLTADEVHEYLTSQHRIYVSVDIANWIAEGFQKAFDKGYQLGSGDGETSFIPRSLKGLETSDCLSLRRSDLARIKGKTMKNVQICEGIEGMCHYHLCPSDDATGTKSLCGKRTMSSSTVLSSWGFKPKHMPALYCEKCKSIATATAGAEERKDHESCG